MAYATENFKSKKALKEAVALAAKGEGKEVRIFSPAGIFPTKENGTEFLEGPHYPAPHTWYAQVQMENGVVKKVK